MTHEPVAQPLARRRRILVASGALVCILFVMVPWLLQDTLSRSFARLRTGVTRVEVHRRMGRPPDDTWKDKQSFVSLGRVQEGHRFDRWMADNGLFSVEFNAEDCVISTEASYIQGPTLWQRVVTKWDEFWHGRPAPAPTVFYSPSAP